MAALESLVVALLLETQIGDESRDSSIAWELKHQAGVTQFARLLAAKRGLNVELTAAGALLHDIYVITTGSYEDHARRGGPIACELLDQAGSYEPDEKETIFRIVVNHSDKHIFSDDAYAEFGKDVDVLDCLLYPDAIDEYLMSKPLYKVQHYLARAKTIWAELGMPVPRSFNALDSYTSGPWLLHTLRMSATGARELVSAASSDKSMDPFAARKGPSGSYLVYAVQPFDEDAPSLKASEGEEYDWLESISDSEIALIWPCLGRYDILSEEDATRRGVFEGSK